MKRLYLKDFYGKELNSKDQAEEIINFAIKNSVEEIDFAGIETLGKHFVTEFKGLEKATKQKFVRLNLNPDAKKALEENEKPKKK